MLGYVLGGPDNDSYMLRGDMPHPACDLCGYVIDHDWVDPSFKPTQDRFDASYTYDGYFIVSERFREVMGERGAHYLPLPSEPGFYVLRANETVVFDAVRRRTRFETQCVECGRFEAVAGASPVFLVRTDPLPERVVRTDIEFGTGDEKHPLILVGPRLGNELAEAALRWLELEAVSE